MPIHWNSHIVFDGLQEIGKCRSELLHEFKNLLDEYWQWDKSLHYYDVIAGDWLEHFAHITYGALLEISTGGEFTPLNSEIPVSSDPSAHSRLRWNDSGLHAHVRDAVGRMLAGHSTKIWKFSANSVQITSGRTPSHASRMLRSFATHQPEVLLVEPYFKCGRIESAATLFKWRHWAALDDLQYRIEIKCDVNKKWRINAAFRTNPSDTFIQILRALLPLHLPVALLEGFGEYRNATLAIPILQPKVIYSANALQGQLTFKILAAEWRESGTQLIYHQHGGGYGIDRVHTLEDYEARVSDKFFTFGWKSETPSVSPLSPSALPRLRKTRKHVLLTCMDFPKVVYRIHFHPMPGRIEVMHRETCDFLAKLHEETELLIRACHTDYGWGFQKMMREAAPNAKFDDHHIGAIERYAESRIVIHNYLGTSWLETLALNIPTLCFFDSEAYAFRSDAQPLIDKLEQVGILYRSGSAAAKGLASIGKDYEGWWSKPEVQEARHHFVNQYANFSDNWRQLWEAEFEAITESA